MQNTIASGLQRLETEQNKGLKECLERTAQWTKFKEDYVILHKKLIELPDKLHYDVNVPFGSLAFMPGRMVHTNEVMVLLGDDWFVERSAKQAAEIVARRIADCDLNLSKFDSERLNYENWLQHTAEMQKDVTDGHEIMEEYDEEKERLWREQHRSSVKKLKQLERADRSQFDDQADIWNKLNDLEKVESTNEEFLNADKVDEVDLSSSPSLSDECETEESASSDDQPKTKKPTTLRVSFGEKHLSVSEIEDAVGTNTANDNKVTSESSVACIKSPADIYKQFGDAQSEKPHQLKSILKRSSSSATDASVRHSTTSSTADAAKPDESCAKNMAVSDTIVERDLPMTSASSTGKSDSSNRRVVSKFRAQRNAR